MASLAAAELGMRVTLYEIDKDAVDFIQSIDTDGRIQACHSVSEWEHQSFDLIYVDNVIEHVRDPRSLIEFLYERLNQNGCLIFKTPQARSGEMLFHPLASFKGYIDRVYQFNDLKQAIHAVYFRPWTLDPPRHLFAFSLKSLMLLAEQTEVDKFTIDYYRLPLWEYSLLKKLHRQPRRFSTAIKMIGVALIVPVEMISKAIEALLQLTNAISAGGLILKIQRGQK